MAASCCSIRTTSATPPARATCSAISCATRRAISSFRSQGPIVLFDYPQSYHVSAVVDTVSEVRPSKLVWSSVSGRDNETAGPFADEIADLMRTHGGGSKKVGMDRCSHLQALALEKRGLEVARLPGRDPRRARDQDAGRGAVPADQHGGRRSRGRRGARCGKARRHRERAVRRHVLRDDPPGRRVHRDAPPDLRPAHQSLVQRGRRAARPAGRAGGARYRHDRLLRLFLRLLAHLPLRPGQADREPEDAVPDVARPDPAQHRHHQAGPDLPRDRGCRLEDPRQVRRAALYLGHARRRHAWRDAVHRPCHRFRDLRPRRHAAARHGGERRELYRRKERPRGREARGGGAGDGARRRS